MFPFSLKTFVHPHSVYRLQYPSHWDQLQEKDAQSCGFGPHDRDDVGLWISIMPMSVDSDRLAEDLPKLMTEALQKSEAINPRQDPTLRHHGMVADMSQEGQGGQYWVLAGGDVVLFASTQVPIAEREVWNPLFQQVMASLEVTRDEHLLMRKVVIDVMTLLKERKPDQEFELEDDKIRGRNQVVYLSNLFREVRAAPDRRAKIIKHFVDKLCQPQTADFGKETLEESRTRIVPVLKPRNYVERDGPTQHLPTTEWLSDVVICYAIKRAQMFRFLTGWDLDRWGIDLAQMHEMAMNNLGDLHWPKQLMGARFRDTGRVIIVDTGDGLASSRLLHPQLHKLFSGPLGSPFWAGIPCRDTLVLYSDRKMLKQRIGRKLKKDHDASAYSITPQPFMVTRDGIAPAPKK
jgi:uncharacterized protein YtpQ (UPF0354 family)